MNRRRKSIRVRALTRKIILHDLAYDVEKCSGKKAFHCSESNPPFGRYSEGWIDSPGPHATSWVTYCSLVRRDRMFAISFAAISEGEK